MSVCEFEVAAIVETRLLCPTAPEGWTIVRACAESDPLSQHVFAKRGDVPDQSLHQSFAEVDATSCRRLARRFCDVDTASKLPSVCIAI